MNAVTLPALPTRRMRPRGSPRARDDGRAAASRPADAGSNESAAPASPTLGSPPTAQLPAALRRSLIAAVVLLHAALAFALMQPSTVRDPLSQPLHQARPMAPHERPALVYLTLAPPAPGLTVEPSKAAAPPRVLAVQRDLPPGQPAVPRLASPPAPTLPPTAAVAAYAQTELPAASAPGAPTVFQAATPPSPEGGRAEPFAPSPTRAADVVAPTLHASDVGYASPPRPVYPALSRQLGEEGRVTLRVRVDATGTPAEVTIVTSSGYGRLDEAARRAAQAARFLPYTVGGAAQAVWVLVPIAFSLDAG